MQSKIICGWFFRISKIFHSAESIGRHDYEVPMSNGQQPATELI